MRHGHKEIRTYVETCNSCESYTDIQSKSVRPQCHLNLPRSFNPENSALFLSFMRIYWDVGTTVRSYLSGEQCFSLILVRPGFVYLYRPEDMASMGRVISARVQCSLQIQNYVPPNI